MKKCTMVALSILLILCFAACSGPTEVVDKPYSVTIGDTAMDGLFTGTFENKQPNGQGTFTYTDESITVTYKGNWENGMPVGEGNLNYQGFHVKYGDVVYAGTYEGDALAGLPHGNGTFSAAAEDTVFIYSGEWKDGIIAGVGNLEIDGLSVEFDGQTLTGLFKGEVLDGIPSGIGAFSMEDGEKYLNYTGGWQEGRFYLPGTLDTNFYTVRFRDGVVRVGEYTGDVFSGIAHGEGTFSAVNDNGIHYTYVGSWKDGLFHGDGERQIDAETYDEKGTFEDGVFAPSPADFFVSLGTHPDKSYTIGEKALAFLKKTSQCFSK